MIELHVGVSGAGKSHGVRASVYDYAIARRGSVGVLDYERDWSLVPRALVGSQRVRAYDSAERALEWAGAEPGRVAIIRPRAWDQRREVASEIARWVASGRGRGIALCEAHRVMPRSEPLDPDLDRIITAWRHHDASVWLDTQRLSLLSRTATEQAGTLYLYAISGEVDLRRVREIGGRYLEHAVRECAARLASGEPGWRVRLDGARMPPYELERSP